MMRAVMSGDQEHRQAKLLRLIDERLATLGMSERKACLNATVGVDFVRDIRRRGHSPNAEKLARLARALGLPAAEMLATVTPDDDPVPEKSLPGNVLAESILAICYIVGVVEAGAWREAVELPKEEWEAVGFGERSDFRGAVRFGLRMRGPSMNVYYPPGTVLDCVKFIGMDRRPKPEDHVIVYRRGPGDLWEATVKELIFDNRRWELWPRSTHPAHQSPIVLDHPPDDDENEDVRIAALVIGSYQFRA